LEFVALAWLGGQSFCPTPVAMIMISFARILSAGFHAEVAPAALRNITTGFCRGKRAMECGGKRNATPLWVRRESMCNRSCQAKAPSPRCFAGGVQDD